jgi:hypothetical protein
MGVGGRRDRRTDGWEGDTVDRLMDKRVEARIDG